MSPSKGLLAEVYNPVDLASIYTNNGAAAVSVLTDKNYFGGSLTDLKEVSNSVSVPVIRKDFIIEPYQVLEARAHGADSFLLLAGNPR